MELNFNHFAIKTQPGMEDDLVRAGFLMHLTDRQVERRSGDMCLPAVSIQIDFAYQPSDLISHVISHTS